MTSDKRTAILQATLKLVSERGFHGTPMSMIAKEAGVSAGIIYHYFDSKEALIDELYKALKKDLSQAMLSAYSEDLPLRERFRTIWLNTLRYYMRHPEETAFMEQYANSPFWNPSVEDAYMEYFAPLVDLTHYAMHEGIIKPMPDTMFFTFTFGLAASLAKQHAVGAIVLDEAMQALAVDACWDAIRR